MEESLRWKDFWSALLCSRGPCDLSEWTIGRGEYKGHFGSPKAPVLDAQEILEEPARQGDRFIGWPDKSGVDIYWRELKRKVRVCVTFSFIRRVFGGGLIVFKRIKQQEDMRRADATI